MAYSAYHSSHSQALRPTNSQPNATYEPVDGHDSPSPVDSRHNPFATPFDHSSENLSRKDPFASQHDYSSDAVNQTHQPYQPYQPHDGAKRGGNFAHQGGDLGNRQYGDAIPLQDHRSNPGYEPSRDAKKAPFVGEAAMSQEELTREAQRQKRRERERQRADQNKGLLGVGTGRIAWVVYAMTLIQLTVFIAEIVKNSVLMGTPIAIKPSFNIMIGPSPYVLINMGSRFISCMKDVSASGVTPDLKWSCPNSTSTDPTDPSNQCSLAELCGNGAQPGVLPIMQWWRFISPIFLHVGLIHIGFNMLLQMTLGREIEHLIGSIRFFVVYMACGIFGFILGGNFAARGQSSMGASGALFGILALSLLDLFYTWGERKNPGKELIFLLIDIVISLVLGLLPGLDNFAHIGGLLMGLALGICILRSPDVLRRRIVRNENFNPNRRDNKIFDNKGRIRAQAADYSEFTKGPVGFFRGRTPFWWVWWLVRAGCLVAVVVCFIVLINNFYIYENQCSWCKYLSCLPITTNGVNWCDIGAAITRNTSDPQKSAFGRSLTSVNLGGFM